MRAHANLVSDSRQSVYQLLQPFVSLSHLHEQDNTNPDHTEFMLSKPCLGRAHLKEHSDNSQAVFFCHSLLKETVLVRVPVDQMELKTDAIIRMDLGTFTQILTKSTRINGRRQM